MENSSDSTNQNNNNNNTKIKINNAKNRKKRIIALASVPVIIGVIIVFSAVITYFTQKTAATDVPKETSKKYTETVRVEENGTIKTDKTVQELWDELIEEGYDIEQELDGPEDLEKLLNAELVTQLPDMRTDVTQPINWDANDNITSNEWTGSEPEYIEEMRNKAMYYGSKTDYAVTIDCDKCRMTIFKKNGNSWDLFAGWNTVQGVRDNTTRDERADWYGPRSCTNKGLYRLKGWKGSRAVILSTVDDLNSADTLDVQAIESNKGIDPDKMELSDRFQSLGCTVVSSENSRIFNSNVTKDSTIVVFDKYNPWPTEWEKWDQDQSCASPISSEPKDLKDKISKYDTGSNFADGGSIIVEGKIISYQDWVEHAKKSGDFLWDSHNKGVHSQWHYKSANEKTYGGDINAYTQAINILWCKDYTTAQVHSVVIKNNPEWKTKLSLFHFNSEKSNEYFNVKHGRTKRSVDSIQKALESGKVVLTLTESNRWRNSSGKIKSWSGQHWGVIFLWDGTYFHIKGGGSGHIADGIYTPSQLKDWLEIGSYSSWKEVDTLERSSGGSFSTSNIASNSSLNGIIKFKRHDNNGNEYYITYSDPTTFQNQIEIYNKTGSESAKEYVMSHFTLKEKPKSSSGGVINGTGSFPKYNLSDTQLDILAKICAREQGTAQGAAAEASLMANLFELSGSSYGNGADGLYNYVINSGWFGTPGDRSIASTVENDILTAVKAVLVQGYRTLPKYVNEHDCFEDLASVNGKETGLRGVSDFGARCNLCPAWVSNRSQYKQNETKIENVYDSVYTFYCFPAEGSDPFGYTSEANRQKYGDFCYEYGTWKPINGTEDENATDVQADESEESSTSENKEKEEKDNSESDSSLGMVDANARGDGYPEGTYISSAGIKYKQYRQDVGSWADSGYWDGSIKTHGCGPTSTAILASGLIDDSITPLQTAIDMQGDTNQYTLKQEMEKLGMSGTIIQNESPSDIVNALKDGKVMLVSVNGPTRFTAGSHIMAIVDINTEGKVYVINPNSMGPTSSPSGWYDPSELISGSGYNDYIITTQAKKGIASSSTSNSNTAGTPGYQAVVGTFTEVDKFVEADGPNVEDAAAAFGVSLETTPQYSMSTTIIDYEPLVQPYTLQFDFLYALLIMGQDKSFVMDLADLAYNSEIEVSVYDNLTTTVRSDNWSYIQVKNGWIRGNVSYSPAGISYSVSHDHVFKEGTALEEEPGYINRTVETRTNSVNYALTKANTWVADYEIEYNNNYGDPSIQTGGKDLEQQVIQPKTVVDYSNDTCDVIENAISNVVSDVNSKYKAKYDKEMENFSNQNQSTGATQTATPPTLKQISAGDVEKNITMTTKVKRVKIHDSTEDSITTQKYTAGTASVILKDDEKTEPNFVTLFNSSEHEDAYNNILDGIEIIFEIMEENNKLANTLKLFKYFIYKATDEDYGVTKFDKEKFLPGSMNPIYSGGENLATTEVQRKVLEYALSKLNCPYEWGSAGPLTFDCSGLTSAAYAHAGITISHSSAEQPNDSQFRRIPLSDAQPGDILYKSGHVGLHYRGNTVTGDYIHANAPGGSVRITSYSWWNEWIGALRYKGN